MVRKLSPLLFWGIVICCVLGFANRRWTQIAFTVVAAVFPSSYNKTFLILEENKRYMCGM